MLVDAANDDLHECAGQLLLLPRRGLFTGPQPDDDVAETSRLPRRQRHLTRLAITLVEKAEHRDPLCHRRPTVDERRSARIDRFHGRIRGLVGKGKILLYGSDRSRWGCQHSIAEPAAHPQHHDQNGRGEPAHGHPSGVQAS